MSLNNIVMSLNLDSHPERRIGLCQHWFRQY